MLLDTDPGLGRVAAGLASPRAPPFWEAVKGVRSGLLERWEPLGWAGGLGARHQLHLVLRSRERVTCTLAQQGQGLAGRSRHRSPLRQLGHRPPAPSFLWGPTLTSSALYRWRHTPGKWHWRTPTRVSPGAGTPARRSGWGWGGAGEPARFCSGSRDSGRHARQSAGGAGASARAAAGGPSPRLPSRTVAFLLACSPARARPWGPVTATLASREARVDASASVFGTLASHASLWSTH